MKIQAIIFVIFLAQCFCSTKKLQTKLYASQERDLESYAKSILTEINEYRFNHQYDPEIQWNKKLGEKANQEAMELKKSNDFGSNSRFNVLQKEIDDANFLTEFTVKIETPSGIPNQKAFAIMVVEAILQDNAYNFMQKYTDAGIALSNTKKNEYLVVIQLIRKLGIYKSCKEAKEKGDLSDQIFIKRNGKKEILNCDQKTENGGWSLILDMNKVIKAEPVYISVDDRDLKYKELLFRAKEGFHLSYNKLVKNSWEMDGLQLQFFYFKFGNTWYSEAQCKKGGTYKNPKTYDKNKDVKVIIPATKCFWGGSNQPARCAKEFIITKLPEGKLTLISELHTFEQIYIANDYFDLFFDLYVR